MLAAHPVLTCAEAKDFEATYFAGDEAREWTAMQRAGCAVAEAVLRDFQEIGGFPPAGRVLVLVGKGHNAGDALIAASRIAALHPQARIEVRFVFGERTLRPLAQRAWRDLAPVASVVGRLLAGAPQTGEREQARGLPAGVDRALGRSRFHSREREQARGLPAGSPGSVATSASEWDSLAYDLVLDGVFGYPFRPPLAPAVAALLAAVNALPIRLRAAVDLPSGLGEPDAFRADFTYATGLVKTPVLHLPNAGRLRYLDLGFFASAEESPKPLSNLLGYSMAWVLAPEVLDPLRALRPSQSDKRTFGHLFIVGGSRHYPGAVLMSVLAALRSGVGLVTAFVPETLAPAFAARLPEAMWVGWPETPEGGLALEGSHLLRGKISRATALLIGPGLGREPETLALAKDIVAQAAVPLVIDADALQPDIVSLGNAPRILTPHAGELARIERAIPAAAVTIRKGPITCIHAGRTTYHSFFGGPVLARGGSGDLLAGLTAGLLAQTPSDPLGAAARGTVWLGAAADALARSHGQVAVTTTQVLDFLADVLREKSC